MEYKRNTYIYIYMRTNTNISSLRCMVAGGDVVKVGAERHFRWVIIVDIRIVARNDSSREVVGGKKFRFSLLFTGLPGADVSRVLKVPFQQRKPLKMLYSRKTLRFLLERRMIDFVVTTSCRFFKKNVC